MIIIESSNEDFKEDLYYLEVNEIETFTTI